MRPKHTDVFNLYLQLSQREMSSVGFFSNIIKGGSHNVSFNFHFEFRFNFARNWRNLRVPIPLEDGAHSLGPAKSSDFITNDIGYMIISDELSILKLDALDQ